MSSFFKARADTLPCLPGEAKQWEIVGTSIMTFETELQILKMTLPQKNGHRIKTPSLKFMILVSSCWKKNFIRNYANHFVPRFLEIIDRRCCILSGPPCIGYAYLL